MPHYHWKKSPHGTTRLERVDATVTKEQEMPTPSGTDLPTGDEGGIVVHRCEACIDEGEQRDFKMPAQLARHFNSSHEELVDDKDSWRDYQKEVTLG